VIINEVHEGIEKYKKRKRLGRGTGSGLGKTSGRGHKGQRSRAGHSQHPTFQGGAMPMIRRIAKRGFNNKFADKVGEVNVADLEQRFEAGDEVNIETLKAKALANYRFDVLKVLGKGEISKKLTVSAHRFSESAKQKIEAAGGTCVVLPGKKAVVKNKQKPLKKRS
jgi:large subunit ribosomal protein L15